MATVSEHGNEDVIANYVKNQGNEYKKLFRNTGIEGQLNKTFPICRTIEVRQTD